MANIVITSTTNTIKVDFGIYSPIAHLDKGCWRKENITFQLAESASFVKVLVENQPNWAVSWNTNPNALQIDSVGGAAPTSNGDLYDKLVALLG